MYDLTRFSLSDMTRFGVELRTVGAGAASMEEVGGRIVNMLYQQLSAASPDERACALVRTFVTTPFSRLDERQQAFAARIYPEIVDHPNMKCMALLATAGDEPAWNDRRASNGHQAIPLPSEESIARSPMISQLIRQLGVEVGALLEADPALMVARAQHTFNVFHIADAVGSPYIPAQEEFVLPYGIRSVIGFGGLVPPGELYATILFAREPIRRDVAELFKPLALNVKVALLPFAGERVFA